MAEPKVRFKRDDGSSYPAWTVGKLGDITEKVDRKAPKGSTAPVMMVSQGNGFIYQADKYSRENAGQSLKNYTLLKQGEFAYNHGASKAKPYGVAYCLTEESEARVPFVYHTFRIADGVNPYWHEALNTTKMDRLLKRMVSSGARMDGLLNINYDTYMDVDVNIPCVEEQEKIADFLSSVDDVIVASEEEVANLETQKKSVMKKIFSQEVRFKRADGSDFSEWEQKYLGDVVGNITSVKRIHAEDWRDSGVPFYRAREIVALYNKEPISPLFIDEELYENFSAVSGKIQPGDLLVTGVGTIGVPYLVKHGDKFYFKDGNIIWIQNNGNINGQFLYALYGTPDLMNQLINMSGKGTVHTYTIENAKKTVIPVPCLEEQRLIADFLSDFDEAIAAAKKELELWKELKKGLLQQMFV